MCYRCRGHSRKPIESVYHYEVYRGEIDGVAWKDLEAAELVACASSNKESGKDVPHERPSRAQFYWAFNTMVASPERARVLGR